MSSTPSLTLLRKWNFEKVAYCGLDVAHSNICCIRRICICMIQAQRHTVLQILRNKVRWKEILKFLNSCRLGKCLSAQAMKNMTMQIIATCCYLGVPLFKQLCDIMCFCKTLYTTCGKSLSKQTKLALFSLLLETFFPALLSWWQPFTVNSDSKYKHMYPSVLV